jgi:hypothetical protein
MSENVPGSRRSSTVTFEASFLAKQTPSGIVATMRKSLLLAFMALAFVPSYAHAYIDPNVGGWLYQLLFPLLIAIAGAWAALRHKISEFFAMFARRMRDK